MSAFLYNIIWPFVSCVTLCNLIVLPNLQNEDDNKIDLWISAYVDANTVQAHSRCQLFSMQCCPEHWQHIHNYVCYQLSKNEEPHGTDKHRDKQLYLEYNKALSVLGIMKQNTLKTIKKIKTKRLGARRAWKWEGKQEGCRWWKFCSEW